MSTRVQALLQRGTSLIELIVFIVIVSTAMAGILAVMDQVTRHSADPLIRKQALAVAESMLEEIQLLDLSAVGCAVTLGQNAIRTGATSVCQYNGYSTSGGIKEFDDVVTTVPGLENYDITGVVVTPIFAFGGTAITPGSGVEIAVSVATPAGETITATGYRVGD